MLLHYVILLLNVFIAASVESAEPPELGWDPRHQDPRHRHGPRIGGTYAISRDHVGNGVVSNYHIYRPFVVVHWDENSNMCRVVRMDRLKADGAQSAMYFFEYNAKVTLRARKALEKFYIFPGERYYVKGVPEIMRRWQKDLMIMGEHGVERLLAASDGLVDGWDKLRERWPEKGGIYWVLPRYLGFKPVAGFYIPCIAFCQHGRSDKYRVVRIYPREAPGTRLIKDVLGDGAKLQTSDGKIDFTTLHILPRQDYVVKANPQIMQIRNKDHIKMSAEDLERLMAASDGLVHGWNGSQDEPQVGGVYWMLPRDLELEPRLGEYIPCVVIGQDGNKCRVLRMYVGKPDEGGICAKDFFENQKMKTKASELTFRSIFLIPGEIYEVEANCKIMQLWGGHLTQMSTEAMWRLADITRMIQRVHHHRREIQF